MKRAHCRRRISRHIAAFADALLEYLQEPGTEIKKLFGKARDRVFERTSRA